MGGGEVVIPILKMRKTEAQRHTVISPSVTEQKSTSAWTRGRACGAQIGVPSPRPRPVAHSLLSTTPVPLWTPHRPGCSRLQTLPSFLPLLKPTLLAVG